jgi:hypothetical protein
MRRCVAGLVFLETPKVLSRTQESNILSKHSSAHVSPVISADSTVGWGPELQVGKSQVRFLTESLMFIIDVFLQAKLCSWGDSTSNRNENQDCLLGYKGDRCLGLTTLLPSWAVCLEIWESQESRSCQDPSKPVRGLLYFLLLLSESSVSFLHLKEYLR